VVNKQRGNSSQRFYVVLALVVGYFFLPYDVQAYIPIWLPFFAALGLEVYGGDAIVSQDGAISVIDLNAWPSFALFRPVAAGHIATLLAARFARTGAIR